ncbi:DUF2812 domain-containing protein [Nocardiopsis tropica]|uniref:DUF2812 domain-containing protein n=1 Tax=Nocardiopsis tropica TaxID=109330 RepID=A0ABU7KRE6_9ACTN|nr:DUF2812 domain-containing protein [Nocardiopsis umidischolae]MEE2051881.1 DUF2812 domain-containing protein [Nocardiopsis umidischolae]
MSDYFGALAARLREHGVDGERSRALLDDLSAHAAESGADPEEEFGPVEEFAAALTRASGEGDADGTGAGPEDEALVWTADAFEAPARLNEMGAQGWEVERVDRLGRFVSRRPAERPQTWEYRQEVGSGRADRELLEERLAPGGWEPCGRWSVLSYFKRPGSVAAGPGAELDSPPAVGGRRHFFGRKGVLVIGASLVVALVAGGWSVLNLVSGVADTEGAGDLAGFAAGAAVGAITVLLALWGAVRLVAARRERSGG